MNDVLCLCSLTFCFSGRQHGLISCISGDHLDLAAAGAVLRYDELLIDLLLQFSDMGDDPDEAMPLGELRERLDRRMQRILVEGAEALIDEHGVEADAADARADLVAESEGEAE